MPSFPGGIRALPIAALCCGLLAGAPRAAVSAKPAPARTGAKAGDTLDLPGSVTRGLAAPDPAQGVHYLDGEALRRFATLEDALASLPGFSVRRAGGLGGYSEIGFRGARASAVAVYVDGVRLNQDGDGAPDLSKWPALWFSSLTARTGFDATGSDPGALARLDLSTRSAHRAEAHARSGSFGVLEGAAQVSATLPGAPAWRVTASAQGQAARNDYPVSSDNGTVYNPDDDATWDMDNNAYRSRGARVAARREDGGGSQSASVLWLESRKEYPGLFPSSSRAYTTRTDWLAAWRLERFASRFSWEAGAQVRRLQDAYRDPGQTLGAFSLEQARVSTAAEAEAAVGVPFSARALGAWTSRADVRLRAEDVAPTAKPFNQEMASPAAQRHEGGAGLRVTGRALPTRPSPLVFTAEVRPAWIRFRADGVRSFPSGPLSAPVSETFAHAALRVAAEWPTRAGTWSVVARREPRAPSSGEYLGDNNGIQHNPDLRAEETRSASLLHGARIAGGGWSAESRTTLYANAYGSPIRLAGRGASPFLHYENGADYRTLGVEWSGRAASRRLEGSLAFAVQDAEIAEGLDAGNRPAYLSEAEAHAELFLAPVTGARFGPLVDYRGPYYPGDANIPDSRRGAVWELGAHAGYARGPARVALDARNLLDRRTRDFARSPRSGRSLALSLSITL